MLYFVLGFGILGAICWNGARCQEREAKLLQTDPNLHYRAEKTMQTVKYLNAYAIGCEVVALLILFKWLFFG